MVEYDINSSSAEYLEVFSLDRVDQTAVPLAGIVWPTPKHLDPEECRSNMPLILVANDQVDSSTLSNFLGSEVRQGTLIVSSRPSVLCPSVVL